MSKHYFAMKNFDPDWANYHTSTPGHAGLKGVYHLAWIMDRLTIYFISLQRGVVTPCLDPMEIINHINLRKAWEPVISPTFYIKYKLAGIVSFHGVPPCGPSGARVATDMTTLTPGTIITPVTTPPRPGPPSTINTPGTPVTTSTRVDNNDFNNTLFGLYKTSQVKSAELRKKVKEGTLPALPLSQIQADLPTMCLAWHTKGLCNMNCPRKVNHVTNAPIEYTGMVEWCSDNGYRQE
jgi:hypothetical protein